MQLRILSMVLATLLLLLIPAAALADCTPAAPDAQFTGAVAAVQGKVTTVADSGRKAVIEVTGYAGPGSAPVMVHLPPTERSSEAGTKCEDVSVKFKPHQEYVVYLGDVPPKLALAYPRGLTAVEVKGAGDTHLADFAKAKGYEVMKPGPGAQPWRPPSSGGLWVLLILAAVGVVMFVSLRLKKKG